MGATSTPESLDIGPALRIIEEMSPITDRAIIPLLQRLQDEYGHVPREVVLSVCQQTGLPVSRVYGVATFYEQFHLEPRGRHLIRCCRGTACHVRGAPRVIGTACQVLGIEDGGTTEDGLFSLETVACLGACALAPVVVIDGKYQGQVTPRKMESALRRIAKEES
jgi:NADH-quinone oxidoreductase subunit E